MCVNLWFAKSTIGFEFQQFLQAQNYISQYWWSDWLLEDACFLMQQRRDGWKLMQIWVDGWRRYTCQISHKNNFDIIHKNVNWVLALYETDRRGYLLRKCYCVTSFLQGMKNFILRRCIFNRLIVNGTAICFGNSPHRLWKVFLRGTG